MSKLLELISDIMPMDVAKYVVMPYVVETREHWKEEYEYVMDELEIDYSNKSYKGILRCTRKERIHKRLQNTYNKRYGDDRFNAVLCEMDYVHDERRNKNRSGSGIIRHILVSMGLVSDFKHIHIKRKVLGFDSELINKKYESNYLYHKDKKALAPDYIRYKYNLVIGDIKYGGIKI